MKKYLIAGLMSLTMVMPALAFDFTQPLKQIDGKPFVDEKTGKEVETTLGSVVEQALLSQYADERDPQTGKETIAPEEKFKRWQLAGKVRGKDVTLSPEDVSKIKNLVGKAYPPLVVGQVWIMLDPSLK